MWPPLPQACPSSLLLPAPTIHSRYNGALVTIPAARNRPQLVAAMRPGALKGPLYNPQARQGRAAWGAAPACVVLCTTSQRSEQPSRTAGLCWLLVRFKIQVIG